jgi:hypothetical protein
MYLSAASAGTGGLSFSVTNTLASIVVFKPATNRAERSRLNRISPSTISSLLAVVVGTPGVTPLAPALYVISARAIELRTKPI